MPRPAHATHAAVAFFVGTLVASGSARAQDQEPERPAVARAHTVAKAAPPGPPVALGVRPAHAFLAPVLGGAGVLALGDLRGRPTLVEFCSTRCGASVAGAVPAALELQERYGDRLHVLFVETWVGAKDAGAFALANRWLGSGAMLTCEAPFAIGSEYLPRTALLSASGEVVLLGNPLTMKREFEKAVDREVRYADGPPEGLPSELRPAWSEFQRGSVARAIELARAHAADLRLGQAARAAEETFRARTRARLDWVDRLVETGHYVRAEALLNELRAGLGGDAELDGRCAGIAERLGSDELRRELAAGRALFELERELLTEGSDLQRVAGLEGVAKEYAGTRAAERAEELLELARAAL